MQSICYPPQRGLFGMSMAAGFLALASWLQVAYGQSTDSARPTPLSSKQLRGNIAAHDDTIYYYTFLGGPGKVTIRLNLQKQEEFAYLKVEVLDAGGRSLLTLTATSSDNDQRSPLQ